MSTVDWLRESLTPADDDTLPISRCGRLWKPIAGFSRMGSIFCIYKDEAGQDYCAHVGEEWREGEEPVYGYFSTKLTWDELITNIAGQYDAIRANRT